MENGIRRADYDYQPTPLKKCSPQPNSYSDRLRPGKLLGFLQQYAIGQEQPPTLSRNIPSPIRPLGPQEDFSMRQIATSCKHIYTVEPGGTGFVENLMMHLSMNSSGACTYAPLQEDPEVIKTEHNTWWDNQVSAANNNDPHMSEQRKLVVSLLSAAEKG